MTITQRAGTWAAATLLSVTAGLVPVASAQERPVSPAAQTAKPAGGMGEGIKVHGHWTIEVKNPDGTQVERHEFDNALDVPGQSLLPAFLGRRLTPGSWGIMVWDGLCPAEYGAEQCRIVESSSNLTASATTFPNLVLGLPPHGHPGAVSLSGSFTAANAGHITRVATTLGSCAGTWAPSTCTVGVPAPIFSGTVLTTPIPVQQGQIVQVTVLISFS